MLALLSIATARAEEAKDVVTELAKKGYVSFVNAVSQTELADKLATGTYTVIAPNDRAFGDLPKPELDALLADKQKLTVLLGHHIVEGKHTANALKSGELKTLSGSVLKVTAVEGQFKIGEARLIRTDVPASNGIAHGTDRFLQAP